MVINEMMHIRQPAPGLGPGERITVGTLFGMASRF